MADETTVYCSSCGGTLSASAQFCRSCGASQQGFTTEEPLPARPSAPAPPLPARPLPPTQPLPPAHQPLAPSPGAWPQSRPTGNRAAAGLALTGGIGMCFMVLYSIVYLPLHYGSSVNYGESPQLGDLLAFASGALAIVLGVLAQKQAPANPARTGAALMLAGLPTAVLAVFWAFPETFHLDYYFSKPIYFGFVYFCELGKAHIGDAYENGYIQVPLVVSSVAVFIAGCLMAFARRRRAIGPSWQ